MALQIDLVTPARKILSQSADEVRAPGVVGSFGVLTGHTEFMSVLKAGELTIVAGSQIQRFAIGEGFAQVAKDKVLILTESADRAEEIDLAGAQAGHDAEAKKLTGLAQDSAEYALQRAKVERVAARIFVASKRG